MGKIDTCTDDYWNLVRFADICNAAMFDGEDIVRPEELSEAENSMSFVDSRESVKLMADKVRRWRGKWIRIVCVENQSYIDYRMVLRCMLSEALGYHSQWKEKAAAHKKNKDLKTDEFMSGIKRSEKYSTLSEDTAFLLEKLTDTKIFRNEKKRGQEWRRGNMCKAFEDYKEEGRQEGKMEAVAEMCREFGLSEEDIISKIMEKCDVSRDTAEEYIKK